MKTKLAWTLVTVNKVQCLLTDGDPRYGTNPNFIQSWSPTGREADVDPARTDPPIGPWEVCVREGAVITLSGNGVRTYVLIPE